MLSAGFVDTEVEHTIGSSDEEDEEGKEAVGVEVVEGGSVWEEVTTEDGQTCYHNTVTDETTWMKPETKPSNTPASMVVLEQGSADFSGAI